eukprot:2469433-Rhodomonas_salina.2
MTTGLPPLHISLPWPWKVAALVAYMYPHTETFHVSLFHIALPFTILGLYLVTLYAPAILFARRQHPALCAHVLIVILVCTIYVNTCLFILAAEPAVAPLAALFASLHILQAVTRTLSTDGTSIYSTADLIPNQHVLSGGGPLAAGAVLAAAWFALPRPTAAPEHVLFVTLTPEVAGTAVWVLARVALSLLS